MVRQINIFTVSFIVLVAIISIAEVKSDGNAAEEQFKKLLDMALESRHAKVVKLLAISQKQPSSYIIKAIILENEKQVECLLDVNTPDGTKLNVQSVKCNEPKEDEPFYNPRLG